MSDAGSTAPLRRQPATALGSAHTVQARPLAAQLAHELMSAVLQGAIQARRHHAVGGGVVRTLRRQPARRP